MERTRSSLRNEIHISSAVQGGFERKKKKKKKKKKREEEEEEGKKTKKKKEGEIKDALVEFYYPVYETKTLSAAIVF